MNSIQILTLAIAIVFPAVGVMGTIAAVLYNNRRLDDLKGDTKSQGDSLRADLKSQTDILRADMNRQFDSLKKHLDDKIDTAFAHMELLLKLHEAEHHKK